MGILTPFVGACSPNQEAARPYPLPSVCPIRLASISILANALFNCQSTMIFGFCIGGIPNSLRMFRFARFILSSCLDIVNLGLKFCYVISLWLFLLPCWDFIIPKCLRVVNQKFKFVPVYFLRKRSENSTESKLSHLLKIYYIKLSKDRKPKI